MNRAANGNLSLAGYGGVFCSHRGFFKGGFTSPLSIAFAFKAELMDVIKAIDYALQFNWTSIWLESDSTYVIHLLKNRCFNVAWLLSPARFAVSNKLNP